MTWNSKNIVFDLDDTLLSESEYFKNVLIKFCHINKWPINSIASIIDNFQYIRLYKKDIFMYFLQKNKKYWYCSDKKINQNKYFLLKDLLFDLYTTIDNKVEPLHGCSDWIDCVQKKSYKVGILTNGVVKAQYNKWNNLDLAGKDKISFIATREAGKEKPSCEAFICMSDRMKTKIKDMVFVGDRFDNDLSYPLSEGAVGILVGPKKINENYGDNLLIAKNLSHAFTLFKNKAQF
jgi:FMN phosphatase YigB (HAD superfamily)